MGIPLAKTRLVGSLGDHARALGRWLTSACQERAVDQQLTGLAGLGDPIRRALYRHVADRGVPVSRDEAAHTAGISRPLAAYHLDKLGRGYDRMVDVWGADHHGYVPRVGAAIEALGGDRAAVEVVIMQLVQIVEAG